MSVSRDDIERKLAEIQADLTTQAEGVQSRLVPVGVVAAIVVVLLAFLIGKRRGKKKTTIVEIRRV